MFTKKDLQVGMLVITKNGEPCLVQPSNEGLILFYADNEYTFLKMYFDDLTMLFDEYNIEKIYSLPSSIEKAMNFDKSSRVLLWQREEPKYYLTLPLGTFEQTGRYLKYDKGSKSYFFGSKYEIKPDEFECGIKTKFTQEEANEVKNIIKSSIEVVEIEGGQGNE